MELKNLLVKFLLIFTVLAIPQVQSTKVIIKEVDNSAKWDNLTESLGQMMMNSEVIQNKKAINILIFSMVDQRRFSEFNRMHQSLLNLQTASFTFSLKEFNISTVTTTREYSILLMHVLCC